MGVGSATDGNSGNTGGVSTSNNDSVSNNGSVSKDSANSVSVNSADKSEVSVRSANETLSETYASRTGISTAVVRAKVENPSITAKNAEPVPDTEFDGHFVGANGQTYPPDTPLSEVEAVTPANGVTNNRTIIEVNGINTDVAGQLAGMQEIADLTGSRVIGVHNATAGTIRDLAQSYGDKFDIGNNPAVDTLADTIYSELRAGRQVDLMAHSQGAIITDRALTDVRNRLQLEDGMSRQEAETLLGNINVETFGGASRRFPDGPNYVHYVNRNDFVPQAFGLRDFLNPFARPGVGAVTHYFREGNFGVGEAHALSTYLDHRVPFDQARQGIFE